MRYRYRVIHIFGASGSGTTTLGREICQRFGYVHLDSDDFFWEETEIPYSVKREAGLRQKLLEEAVRGADRCVVSGSLVGWGDVLIPLFDLAVYVSTSTEVRLKRLREREYREFGERILPGGDMYQNHQEFLSWAAAYDTGGPEMRSAALHRGWRKLLNCPVASIDGTMSLDRCIEELKLCE